MPARVLSAALSAVVRPFKTKAEVKKEEANRVLLARWAAITHI
jgi:hypothetical protein